MRGRGRKKDGSRPVLRCDTLPTFLNPGKLALLESMHRAWRSDATDFGRIQWRMFFENGRFNPHFDPAVRAGVRGVILDALVSRHVERFYERKHGAPSDPRRSNPHFSGRTIAARFLPIAA